MSAPGSGGELARATVRGAAWALATTLGVRLASLVSLAVLARLLVPEDFGLVAFALVFIAYLDTVGDLGTGTALIYWPDRRDDAAVATFWTSLAMGAAWLGVSLLAAGPVAAFFRNPDAAPILRTLAWTFPLRALGNAHDALCQKDLRFRARMAPEAAQAITKAIVAISLALGGLGVWSLVWGHLAGVAVRTVVLWLTVRWRPTLGVDRRLLRRMLGYGRGILAVNVLAAVVHHFDLVAVGRRLGSEALGLYQVAAKVPEMTVALLIWVVGTVLFPALARVQADEATLRRAYLAALRWIALLALPAAAGLFVLAEPLTVAAFGPQWEAAAPVLRALGIYAGLRAIGSHAGDLLKATGRTHLLAALGVGKAALLVPVLFWAAGIDAPAVAVALASVTALTATVNVGVACRLLRIRPSEIAAGLAPALAPTATMTLALVALRGFAAGWPPAALAAVGVIGGAVVYVGAVAVFSPSRLREARELFQARTSDPSRAAS